MATAVSQDDRTHLARALEVAERGRGSVSPNPMVGCVIARDGEAIGEGWHAELGGLHAERAALADCAERGNDPAGATAYVTLEPCAHEGRQPPCADALVEARVARVVYLSDDPSEKASGRGPGNPPRRRRSRSSSPRAPKPPRPGFSSSLSESTRGPGARW